MLVRLSTEELNSLSNDDLCWLCIEPAISTYKQSKGVNFTENYYKKLTKAQQALFMYTVFSRHALSSVEEYYWWIGNLLIHRNAWEETKKGLLLFHEYKMVNHLLEIISILHKNRIDFENPPLSLIKDDSEFLSYVSNSYNEFLLLSRQTTYKIGTYIRSHLNQFVQLENSNGN